MAVLTDQTPWETKDPAKAPGDRAKKKAREKNRDEYEATFLLPGSVKWTAGTVIELDQTFGPKFTGNFLITKCLHSWAPTEGYRVRLQIRKTLKGY